MPYVIRRACRRACYHASMAQVTWRADDELLGRVRHAAARSGWSVNAWISRVLDAATDPELSGSDLDRVRERLARAGLLEEQVAATVPRAEAARVDEARARAGRGTALSDLVRGERG